MYIVANGTQTVAISQGNGEHKLYGYKWFTSATDADIALTLAREQDNKGNTTPVCTTMCTACVQLAFIVKQVAEVIMMAGHQLKPEQKIVMADQFKERLAI